jgi:hypothetical protein
VAAASWTQISGKGRSAIGVEHPSQQSTAAIASRRGRRRSSTHLRQLLLNHKCQKYSKTRKQEKLRLRKDPPRKVENHFVSDVINPTMAS